MRFISVYVTEICWKKTECTARIVTFIRVTFIFILIFIQD